MKNTKEHTATRAGISRRYLDYLLVAERNASPLVARRLEKTTGIARELWVFGTPAQRRAAWKKFQQEALVRQGSPMAPSIQDEINAVNLQGGDLYEHFKAKERAMPRKKRRTA